MLNGKVGNGKDGSVSVSLCFTTHRPQATKVCLAYTIRGFGQLALDPIIQVHIVGRGPHICRSGKSR